MAYFTYECPIHGKFKVSLQKREKTYPCQCGAESKPVIKAGTVQVIERLDNGVMARAVERLHNIEEIMEERSNKFSRKEEPEDEQD